ncbi:MAG: hypothetical protein ACI8RD_013587 [Bacillariaceae sp.]|jgi:hypothetical protein
MEPTSLDTTAAHIDQGWRKKKGFGYIAFIISLLVLSAFLVGCQTGTNNIKVSNKQMLRTNESFGALFFENSPLPNCGLAPPQYQPACEYIEDKCATGVEECQKDTACVDAFKCATQNKIAPVT